MSSSITIPTRTAYGESSKAGASSCSPSSYSTSPTPRTPRGQTASTPASPSTKLSHDRRPSLLSESTPLLGPPEECRASQVALEFELAITFHNTYRTCEPVSNSCIGSSLSKQEHTVINIGDPDGVPRLVSPLPRARLAR